MQLIRRVSPFNTFDATHPLLSYVIREVRGGRTPDGLQRYSRQVVWILGALMFGGLAVTVGVYDPYYQDDYFRFQAGGVYMMIAVAVSIGFFVIADMVTLFYAAHAVRSELRSQVKYELLRTTTVNPADYVASRLALGQVRAWRVYMVLLALRWLAALMAAFMGLWGLGIALYENGLPRADEFFQTEVLFWVSFFTLGICIFLVMLLWEPMWRFRMLTTLGASMAARIRSGFAMWMLLAGAYLLVALFQGALAVGVVTLGAWWNNVVRYDVLCCGNYEYNFRDQASMLAGVLPYMMMPLLVWYAQRAFAGWRWRVTERFVFRHFGDDR